MKCNVREPLSPEELQKLQEEAYNRLADPHFLQAMVEKYKRTYGRVIGADEALNIFPEYCEDKATYPIFARASRKLAIEVYNSYLEEDTIKTLVLLGGGCGSGKSSSREMLDNQYGILSNPNILCYDTTLSRDIGFERTRINAALEKGLAVEVIMVYRPVRKVAEAVVHRAEQNDRCIPLASIASEYANAQSNFLILAKEFEFHPKVHFAAIDNSRTIQEMKLYPSTVGAVKFIETKRCQSLAEVYEDAEAGVNDAYKKRLVTTDRIRLLTIKQISGEEAYNKWCDIYSGEHAMKVLQRHGINEYQQSRL